MDRRSLNPKIARGRFLEFWRLAPQTWDPPSLRCSGHPPVLASATDHIHDRRKCGLTWIPQDAAASGIHP